MNSQFPNFERGPESRPLEELSSRAGALIRRYEIGLRASESEAYRCVASELIQSPETFSLMVPGLIEMLTDPHPRISARASELLLARPHWIGAEQLNDSLFPCLLQEMSNPDSPVSISEVLLGLAPCASEFDDRHVRNYLGVAQASMIGMPGAQQQLALLSFFGERIPEKLKPRILVSLAESVEIMDMTIAPGTAPETEPPPFCQPGISGLFVLRYQIADSIDRNAGEKNIETFLVQLMEKYISHFAERAETGNLPTRFEQYQLLLTYPLISGGNRDDTAERNLDRIQRVLQHVSPAIAEILYRTRDDDMKGLIFDHLLPAPTERAGAGSDLRLLASLMLTARQFEPGAARTRILPADGVRAQTLLEQLNQRVTNPFVFPILSECAGMVNRYQGY